MESNQACLEGAETDRRPRTATELFGGLSLWPSAECSEEDRYTARIETVESLLRMILKRLRSMLSSKKVAKRVENAGKVRQDVQEQPNPDSTGPVSHGPIPEQQEASRWTAEESRSYYDERRQYYYDRYRKLGFSKREIEDIIIRILEDR